MRVKVTLRCNECKQELNKYCPFCKKHTLHTETK